MLDIFVEAEAAVGEAGLARIVPVGDVDVVLGQEHFHRVAQKRREMAGHRRDEQHARLHLRDVFLEMQEGAERRGERRLFGDRGLLVADATLSTS